MEFRDSTRESSPLSTPRPVPDPTPCGAKEDSLTRKKTASIFSGKRGSAFTTNQPSDAKASSGMVGVLVDFSIEVVNDQGKVGLGEGAPFPALTKDDVQTCVSHAGELLSAVQNHSPQGAFRYLASIRRESMSYSRTAFVGVESALWDLLAKEEGLPLAKLWGSAGLTTLTTDITLPIMPPEQVGPFWRQFADYEFPIIKIKVSGHVSSDLDLVLETSRLIGPSVAITLDGNQGYGLANARVFVERLIHLGLRPLFFRAASSRRRWAWSCIPHSEPPHPCLRG